MSGDLTRLRQRLKEGDFRALFIEELGWDRHDAPLDVQRLSRRQGPHRIRGFRIGQEA